MASRTQTGFQLLLRLVADGKVAETTAELAKTPLEKLTADNADTMLSRLLSVAALKRKGETLPVILEAWKRVYNDIQATNLFSLIFCMKIIPDAAVAFMAEKFKDVTFFEVIEGLVEFDSEQSLIDGCARAVTIYGEQSHATYEQLMNRAVVVGNTVVRDFFIAKMEETAEFQAVPPWVKNFGLAGREEEIGRQADALAKVQFDLPSNKEIVELLTAGLAQLGIGLEEEESSKAHLADLLKSATREDKLKLLEPVFASQTQVEMANNQALYRLYGPAHPLLDDDLTDTGPSTIYGGGRMFLCDVYDFDEEFEQTYDWFTGVCEACHKRIRVRWHAVRMPDPLGGWKGCYCSWDCVRDDIPGNAGGKPDLATHLLVGGFEEVVADIGIQDREE